MEFSKPKLLQLQQFLNQRSDENIRLKAIAHKINGTVTFTNAGLK